MKIEPVVAGLGLGLAGALSSLFILSYCHAIGLTSADLPVQILGWINFVSLIILTCLPLLRLERVSARRILTPLESKR